MVRLLRSHYKALADLEAVSLLLLVILFFSRELVNPGKEGNEQHLLEKTPCAPSDTQVPRECLAAPKARAADSRPP